MTDRHVGHLEREAQTRVLSRPVLDVAARMFTWLSERTVATSDSSRVRSSASTWIATRTTSASSRPVHLDDPLGLAPLERSKVRAVVAVHGDPLILGTRTPRWRRPGPACSTAELHPHVAEALHDDALGVGLADLHRRERAEPP